MPVTYFRQLNQHWQVPGGPSSFKYHTLYDICMIVTPEYENIIVIGLLDKEFQEKLPRTTSYM